MKDKLRELAERWKGPECRNGSSHECADELLAIIDAEGSDGAVDFPRYRAIGFDAETNCAEMVADPDGAWVHVMDIPQVHPARSGVVSDEDVNYFLDKYEGKRAHPRSYAHIENARSCLEHFAKGERHER